MRITKGQGKHMKKRGLHISNESRFYALLAVILGIVSGSIFKTMGEIDMTGPIFVILFGVLGYVGTFGEDE